MWPAHIQPIITQWSTELFTELNWDVAAEQHYPSGEAAGRLVISEGFPHRAYLKPTILCEDQHPRAANEKICSDLANSLGLPVPPVLLFRRQNGPESQEKRACISLVAYPAQYEWSIVAGLPNPVRQIVRATLAQNSGIIAFDTYVDNTDRNNANNAIFGVDDNAPAGNTFLFLDFANSLNHSNRWADGRFMNVVLPPTYAPLEDAADWTMIAQAIERIESLSDDVIHSTVNRIPDDYMTQFHKRVVRDGLLARRKLIRPALVERFAPRIGA